MQTFLCEPTFSLSLAHLDFKRLGKQRVEAYQILLTLNDHWAWSVYTGDRTLEQYQSKWGNHPAVLMWRDYTSELRRYYNEAINQWLKRGYKNSMVDYWPEPDEIYPIYPSWYTDELITSHRCRLLQKNYEFYSQYNWNVPDNWKDVRYIWPVRKG